MRELRAIPAVQIVIAGTTTAYLDSAQVLNGGGVDKGHCVNGSFVSARLDESHPWAQIGSGTTSSPTAPQSLAATAGSGSVALSWSAPVSDGGAAITGYNVYRGTTSGGESATPVATNVSTRSFTDAGLTNGTTYYYKVAAVNAVGTSPQSAQAIAMPQLVQATVPAAPAGLVALGGSSSVGLSWSTPVSDGGSAITGYNVFRGTTAGGESATAVATNVKATSFTDTGLTNATTYYYKVAAVNAVGTSPSSGEASATPQATAPSAPLTLVASGGNASVALSWSAPTTDGGSGLTGYNVYRGTSAGGESATAVATNVIVTSFTDTAVTNGATYYYKVAAVNAVGTSPQSNEANATPQQAATVASAPLTLTASSGNATAGLSWSVPASNGGSPITGYNLYRGTTAGGESATAVATNVKATSFTDTGLTNATTYYYKVAAVNAVGTSPSSGEASATPQATAPSAPLTLVASGGNATAGLSWSVPASNGGSPITGYNLYRGTTAGGESTTAVATNVALTSFSDTGLTNGATYYYKVAAVNAVGTSPQSNEASATAQVASTAGFVRRVGSATATGSRTSTVLAVGAPGVVVGHTLVVSLLLSSTSSTTGAVAAADNAGNTYAVVRDVNDGSAGDRTVTLVALSVKALAVGATITATYPSSAETHLSADEFAGVTAVDTSAGATASTAAFSSGATATTGQSAEILIGTLGAESGSALGWAAGWTALPTLAISSDYLDTAYRLVTTTGTFAATGTTGGQWMASIITLKTSGQAPALNVPAAPAGLVALGGSSSVGLSWSTPVSDGGSAITGYNVFRGTTAGGESATAVATNVKATSFTDTGLTNATTYYYKVAAVNAVGTSPSSGEASATPQATAPSAPLTLVASGGNASVALSWSAPTTDGGSGLTGYNVYRGTSAGGESATAVATNVIVTSFTDTAVTNGATYYYKVAAVNAVGTSPQSNEANATPQQAATVASAPLTLTASSGNATAGLSWSVPASNGGSPITGYNLYRGTTAGGESATAVATNEKATSFTDTGLTNATTYYYKVAAVNAVGTSPSSGEASATPQATAPSAPLTLVASGGNATAGLSWSVPASNGGSPITGYNLYRGTTAGGESTTAVATNVALTSFSDTGLTNGATYYYKVAAVNAVGTSPQSNEASATAQVASTAGFVRRVGSATATGSRTSTVLAVGAPGVVAGHTLVVSLLLSSTSSTTGAVAAADNA